MLGTEFGTKGVGQGSTISGGKPGWDDLKNSLVFSWGFLEMMVWFWVSLGTRGEKEGGGRGL